MIGDNIKKSLRAFSGYTCKPAERGRFAAMVVVKMVMTKSEEVKVFEIAWEGFFGNMHLMNIGIPTFEDLCEIAVIISRPVLKEKERNVYHVVDASTVYTYKKRK